MDPPDSQRVFGQSWRCCKLGVFDGFILLPPGQGRVRAPHATVPGWVRSLHAPGLRFGYRCGMVAPGSELAIDVRGEAVSFLVGKPADEVVPHHHPARTRSTGGSITPRRRANSGIAPCPSVRSLSAWCLGGVTAPTDLGNA